jgi:hypothetical protein
MAVRASILLASLAVLATAAPAGAALGLRLIDETVARDGVLRLSGNAQHMPLYALPAKRMPCARYGTCPSPIHRKAAPKRRPYVFLGYTSAGTSGLTAARTFRLRLPHDLRPGRYKVFVWCALCGGSLIVVGSDSSGQTLRVLP